MLKKTALAWISRLANKQDLRPYVALAKALYFQEKQAQARLLLERGFKVLQDLPENYLAERREELPQLMFDINYFLGAILLEVNGIEAKPYLLEASRLRPDNAAVQKLLAIAEGINNK